MFSFNNNANQVHHLQLIELLLHERANDLVLSLGVWSIILETNINPRRITGTFQISLSSSTFQDNEPEKRHLNVVTNEVIILIRWMTCHQLTIGSFSPNNCWYFCSQGLCHWRTLVSAIEISILLETNSENRSRNEDRMVVYG